MRKEKKKKKEKKRKKKKKKKKKQRKKRTGSVQDTIGIIRNINSNFLNLVTAKKWKHYNLLIINK